MQILEEVGEIGAPRDCVETTKLFNTFSMRAKSISWKGSKSDPAATLSLEFVLDNDKKWPIALSNSGNGVLYAVEFNLQGENGETYAPKEAGGVMFSSGPKKLKERPSVGLFALQSNTRPAKLTTARREPVRDINFRITPGEPETGKLTFEVPRDNYLLAIERKFASKPVPGLPTDHISVCKISSNDTSVMKPASSRGMSGVY